KIQRCQLLLQQLSFWLSYVEAFNNDQTILTSQLRQNALNSGAVHFAVQLLAVVLWTRCESHATSTPDRAASAARTGATRAFLFPRLTAATAYFRTVLLSARTLTAARQISSNCLVNQIFIEFATKCH